MLQKHLGAVVSKLFLKRKKVQRPFIQENSKGTDIDYKYYISISTFAAKLLFSGKFVKTFVLKNA